jgi:hypothetical protein
VQPGLRSPGRDPDRRGRLLDGEAEVKAKDENGPVLDAQALEPTLELLAEGDRPRSIGFSRLEVQDANIRGVAPLRPEFVVDGVQEKPMQPAIEAGRLAQRRQIPPAPDEGLLCGILGSIRIAQDEPSDRIQPIDDCRGQQVEGSAIAVSGALDELDPAHVVTAVAMLVCIP